MASGMMRPCRHWYFMSVEQRGPGVGEFDIGEAYAIPFRREPYPTTPLSGNADYVLRRSD